jgi:hypothetical protein
VYDTFIEQFGVGWWLCADKPLHTYMYTPLTRGNFPCVQRRGIPSLPIYRFFLNFVWETEWVWEFRVAYARVARNEINGVLGVRCVCVSVCMYCTSIPKRKRLVYMRRITKSSCRVR